MEKKGSSAKETIADKTKYKQEGLTELSDLLDELFGSLRIDEDVVWLDLFKYCGAHSKDQLGFIIW
jgi:hypothetical protein